MGSAAYKWAYPQEYPPNTCILEIGSERGEGSTAYLAKLAKNRKVPFYSIDPDPQAAERVADLKVEFICGTAEDVLADWDGPAPRFVWADGADWPFSWHGEGAPYHDELVRLRELYKQWGAEVSEDASAASHGVIAIALRHLMSPSGLVVFDDTWRHPDGWKGKGRMAVPFLLTKRFEVQHATKGEEPHNGFVVLRAP